MAHGFKAANRRVDIIGVGTATDTQVVPLDRAAEVLHELQDDKGKPLTGKALDDAAKAFADARGLKVVTLPKEEKSESKTDEEVKE
jgi:hypothetical protein